MRRILTFLLPFLCLGIHAEADYTDHRGHNVDSLETVMAKWTADGLASASDAELHDIAKNLSGLMYGFNQTNGVKSEYYARILLGIASSKGWQPSVQEAAKNIGQHFWAKEQYDSAAFYYGIAMKAIEAMTPEEADDGTGNAYTQNEIDDALSQMYGTIGNLYSMTGAIETAMDYYEKAGVLFKKHGWHNSSSVLYYNMGETMRTEGSLKEAEKYYIESLDYSLLAHDSLAIATAYKGLGSLYLEMQKTSKAMRYLNDANLYFADHEDEELQSRMESLDYTSQVLEMQKRRLSASLILLVAVILLSVGIYLISGRLKKTTQEKTELEEVLQETVESISNVPEKNGITLKPKEKSILEFIAKGYTNAQIAEAMCLSPETIKWYKKKLFVIFDASNSAELVTIAKNNGLI